MRFDDDGRLVIGKGVTLKPYTPRPFLPYELMSDQELRANAGGTLVFDSEFYWNYALIAFRDIVTDKVIKFEIPGDFDRFKLSWTLHNYRCVGFNSFKFDLPLIWAAYERQDTEWLKEIVNKLILENVWRNQVAKDYNFKIFDTPHIDLIEVCPLRGSLKLYGARLHSKRIQELPIDHDARLTDFDRAIVADYCINSDLPATALLYRNLSEQIKLREDLSLQYNINMMSKSDAQIAESVIGSELRNITGKWPSKPNIDTDHFHKFNTPKNLFFQTPYMKDVLRNIEKANFCLDGDGRLVIPPQLEGLNIKLGKSIYRMGIGGLHSSEKCRAIFETEAHELIDKDVASFYPAIVLLLGLYPHHLGPNFLKVYASIRDRRIAAKRLGAELKKKMKELRLNDMSEADKQIAISECLKITINGTFGKTGSPYSFLYAPEMTIQITVGGQLYLLMFIEYLELQGFEVVSANTDGIVINCEKTRKAELDVITKQWESITGFETEETKYKAIYSRDVNAYMAVKHDGEVKGKNAYYDPWRGKSAKDGYWRFQKNPKAQICIEALEMAITKNIPIEHTIKECKDITKFVCIQNVTGGAHKDGEYLGRVIRWYYAHNTYGTINRVNSGHKIPDTEGAKPCMDLPENFPNDIDYQWYVEHTKKLGQECGYLSKQQQVEFF